MKLSEKHIKFIQEEIPLPHNTVDRYEEYIISRIQLHSVLCTVVKKEVIKVLEPLIKLNANRFFCRVDDSQQLKSPISIIDKIQRSDGEFSINNFPNKMTDLARFRVVCNFLNDAERVAGIIHSSQILNDAFNISKKSTINLRPSERKTGARLIKFVLEYKSDPNLHLEIQIMTQLEEAWDKKDHFLVYEIQRCDPNDDKNFSDFLDAKMFAMSSMLYIADVYFDELRGSREDKVDSEGTQ